MFCAEERLMDERPHEWLDRSRPLRSDNDEVPA